MSILLPVHVWVDSTGRWANPHPALLLAWRQVTDGPGRVRWQGWVIQAWMGGAPAHGEAPYVYQAWVDAGHIRPAEAPKPSADLSGYRPVNSDHPGRGRRRGEG